MNNINSGDGDDPRPDKCTLSQLDRELLQFEAQHWHHAGEKEEAISRTFGISLTRYYQQLNRLVDNQAAIAFAPALLTRLRRIRDDRLADIQLQARKF